MNKILLFLAFISISATITAQPLVFEYNGEELENGATISIFGDYSTLLQAEFEVFNKTDKLVKAFARKQIHEGDTVPNSTNYFCWNLCLPPFVYQIDTVAVDSSAFSEYPFQGDYLPDSTIGTSTITYIIGSHSSPLDTTWVTVKFTSSPTGISTPKYDNLQFSNAYPNPANSQVSFDYNLPQGVSEAYVSISNLLGSTVKSIDLNNNSGTLSVNTADLTNGIYFYTLTVGNEVVAARKLVVRH